MKKFSHFERFLINNNNNKELCLQIEFNIDLKGTFLNSNHNKMITALICLSQRDFTLSKLFRFVISKTRSTPIAPL